MCNSEIEELDPAAESMGATILSGCLSHPSENGGFALGDLELDEYLYELLGQELMLIDECPTCRIERDRAKGVIEKRLRVESS